MQLHVDSARLFDELQHLGDISDAPAPAVTRIVFSETDLRARAYVKALCLEANLEVREDAVGNTFARWSNSGTPASDPTAPAIGTGSHMDALPHAGRYDGTVGVLGGLEAIRTLQRSGFRPRRPLELLILTAEEPTRFGIGCLGSRLLASALAPCADETLKDKDGATLRDLRTHAGFSGNLSAVPLPRGHYAGFLELHIEQGPLLERDGIPLGVVTAIAAPAALRLTVEGQGGHAGAVLMPGRHDAFLAACEIALAAESAAKSSGSIDTVATTGICDIFPGAINSIPSRVRLELDIRDVDEVRRDLVLSKVDQACTAAEQARGVRVSKEILNADGPATCDPALVETLARACETHAHPYRRMVSRAYHDSLFISRIAPTAMLFIPCRAGVSHRPDEYASPEDIARGVLVLAEAMAELAS
ncbi:MAG TPA: M20 family metallo-hydrolase [Bryobacteraceae bacterium]|jgi:N-carbamoyl-L-amino-acid hydrolase